MSKDDIGRVAFAGIVGIIGAGFAGGGVYLTVSQCRPPDRRPIHLVTVHPNLCLVGFGKDSS